jgi:D-glycero-alpha-D-manno-heptose 1-phosphate guanylyltransferase
MEAVILAGGMGTRLRDVVKDLPKPMAPVNGKPFLHYLLGWISNFSEIDRIVISTGFRSEIISEYFGESFEGISINYAVEPKPLGTGGAIKFAFQQCTGDNILVLNGDTFFPVNLGRFMLYHENAENIMSVALKPMQDFSRYGNVACSGDIITGFEEKKYCSEGLINGGIYLINKAFIEAQHFPEVFSFEKDVLEKLAGSSLLKCMVFDVPFIDIGIPEDYYKAGEILKNY